MALFSHKSNSTFTKVHSSVSLKSSSFIFHHFSFILSAHKQNKRYFLSPRDKKINLYVIHLIGCICHPLYIVPKDIASGKLRYDPSTCRVWGLVAETGTSVPTERVTEQQRLPHICSYLFFVDDFRSLRRNCQL